MKLSHKIMAAVLALLACVATQAAPRWKIMPSGAIEWVPQAQELPHHDHMEMSGEQISCVLYWGLGTDGHLSIERSLVFPMLRTIPNDAHGSLIQRITTDPVALFTINGTGCFDEKVNKVSIDGCFYTDATLSARQGIGSSEVITDCIRMERVIFPSVDKPLLMERCILTNISDSPVTVSVAEYSQKYHTLPENGVGGSYTVEASLPGRTAELAAGASWSFDITYQAHIKGMDSIKAEFAREYTQRLQFVRSVMGESLVLLTPDNVLNTMFRHAKVRASESIFKTRGGYMHSSGGEAYYAAILAADQAEYAAPFFPFLGYDKGNEATRNTFTQFKRFMSDSYRPVPSAVIAEGLDYVNGSSDRANAAMIAYGAARFALASGRRDTARDMLAVIRWCLYYCHRNPDRSANPESDRIYRDALINSAALLESLGMGGSEAGTMRSRAKEMDKRLAGRSVSEPGESSRDREILDALMRRFCAGDRDEAAMKLHEYSRSRLLGEHVPYAVESWTDGVQRQFSTESSLYCRVIIEGLFGIRPTGLNSFEMTPSIPSEWPAAQLRNIKAFGRDFDINITRSGKGRLKVDVTGRDGRSYASKTISDGDRISVTLK